MASSKEVLINDIAEVAGISKVKARAVAEQVIESIKGELVVNGEFNLVGLGKLVVRHRKERQARNPQTGELATVPAKNVVAFRQSKTFEL